MSELGPRPGEIDLSGRLEFALEMSQRAAEFILTYYRTEGLDVELKGDQSPVTLADRGAEQLMREMIAAEYPADGVLGEEFPETESRSGCRWILDPVDGTKAFVSGVPQFGTLIGLECGTDVPIGVCRFPALNEVMYASRGEGAWWKIGQAEPRRCQVTGTERIDQALLCFTELGGYHKTGTISVFQQLERRVRLARGWGDCFGHMLVATGRADISLDPEMNPWDAAALRPIVEEAGGHYLSWDGRATIHGHNGVSVNGALKQTVLQALQGG